MSDLQQLNNNCQVLRSKISLIPFYVRFKNCTNRNIEMLWINFNGVRVPYKILEPGTYYDVDTFVNHMWIFRDSQTYDKMVVSRNKFSQSHPWMIVEADEGPPSRKVFCIILPVYTLKEICFQKIRDCLTGRHRNIFHLSIPRTLQTEYIEFIESLSNF